MSFINELKDTKFRLKIVLVIIIGVLLYGAMGSEKKEATQGACNIANIERGGACDFPQSIQNIIGDDICMDVSWLTGNLKIESIDPCLGLECKVGRHGESWELDTMGCFSCVPDGLRAQSTSDCCSGKSTTFEYKDGFDYLCMALDPDEPSQQCNSNEETIASIMMGIAPGLSCKSAYYLTIVGGAFALLLIPLAI